MAGATSLIELILKKWGDDIAGAAKELEEKVGFPESVANRIATGELPMDAESVAKRKADWGGDLEYHGTRANGLLEMDPDKVDLGLHTGPVEQANNRLTQTREWADDVRGETIIPLMVRRGNEMPDMRDIGTWSDSRSVAKEMDNVGYDSYERLEELELDERFYDGDDWLKSPENRAGLDEFRDTLLDDGFDSVRYKNQVENDYGGNSGLRRDIQEQLSVLSAREKELLELGKSRKPENPMPDVEGMSPDEAETAINAWLESDSKLGTDYHGEGFRYLSDAEKAEVKALQLERAKLGNNPDNFAETRSTITLRPENLRSPNAAFDPEYTGSNIMGGLALPVTAGLLAAGQSEDADAGPLSKAAKKVADGWDEAAWLAENPRPHPDVKIKDHTPEQRSDYKRWEYEKSKAKAGPAQVREISDAEALWLENNPRPDGDPRTHPEVKTWMNQRSMVRNGQLDPSKSNPKRKYQSAEERRERRRRYASEYRKQNRGYATAQNAKYRAAKLQRTPEYAEDGAINEIYNQASLLSEATGTPYQVDHVIPLQGENVSGLHVPGNLMIVPDKLNTSKSNAFTPGDDPMRFNDVAQKNISEQNARGLLEDGFADPRLLAGTAGTTAAILAAPMVKDSGMISAPRSETLFDLTMGARNLERRLEGSPASLLFPSGLVEYLETVNRREEDPNAMTRGMALLDVLPF